MKTVYIPDGYNGSKVMFFIDPIEVDGELVKLSCAEEGKKYLIRWIHVAELSKLIKEQNQ